MEGFQLVASPGVLTDASATTKWLLLSGAIIAEVTGTMSLRAAVDSVAWMPLVPVAYIVCFALLGLVLRTGMPIGVAYGIWGAAGVSLTAVLGAVLFNEVLSLPAIAGIGLIIVGVVLVETGSRRHDSGRNDSGRHDSGRSGSGGHDSGRNDDDEVAVV